MERIRSRINRAQRIAVLTGAGVSAESGIPTFRGPGGLWRKHRAEELATPEAFARDPVLVWEWYQYRRGVVAQAQPNPAHLALARLEARTPEFTLITQNVDDLHERAGSRNVLHVHGSIFALRCVDCSAQIEDKRHPLPELPPRCICGALVRPGVVWFGECLPPKVWDVAQRAAECAEVFLVIGTSAVVYPAAGLAQIAAEHGAAVVVINLDPTPLSCGDFLQGPAGQILPQLVPS